MVSSSQAVQIHESVITDNEARQGPAPPLGAPAGPPTGDGGGVYLTAVADSTLHKTLLAGNSAQARPTTPPVSS